MSPRLWADAILVVHFAFVLGVIVPVPLIVLGRLLDWRFVRNAWFRRVHLAMIGVVVLQAFLGRLCPLTIWEQLLREAAGDPTYEGSFIAYWVSRLLYHDVDPWVFAVLYTAFGALIVFLYVVVPPERRPR